MRNTVPKMERRHFEFIAETLARLDCDDTTRESLAKQFAGRLSMTNGLFNKDRFIDVAMNGAK